MADDTTRGPDARPNVLWVFGDQHRGQATGYMGDPNVHTPNLDRLASEGFCSTAAVSGFPLCCPYRGSLVTSRYPHHCVPGHEHPIPEGQPTIAHVFNDAGYQTAYIGKWHLLGFRERDGRAAMHISPVSLRGGFQQWTGYQDNDSQWDCWVHGGEGASAYHYRLPGYETDAMTDLMLDYITERGQEHRSGGGKPFFAVLSVQPPHDPYVAPAAWMRRQSPGRLRLRPNVPRIPHIVEQSRRELAGYYAMIENLDWNVGRIRQALADAGLADNTHILFFSDHGDMHGSHGAFRKVSPWEEAIRVPFIIGGGGTHYSPYHSARLPLPINHVDIAPTTLGLCGVAIPEWMEGHDYSACRLEGRATDGAPDSAFLQSVIPTGHGHSIDRPWRGVVTRDGWKYVVLEGQPWLLFNLNNDPYEQANLAFDLGYQGQRRRLQGLLADWIIATDDAFSLPTI